MLLENVTVESFCNCALRHFDENQV